MGKCLIIGCGGVASVAIHKCCQNSGISSFRLTAGTGRNSLCIPLNQRVP